jgi:glycine/D-amino acid oxidase-like deaminating enzyme
MRAITGSSYYASGLYTPGTVMLQPAGYVRGFAKGLTRDGVSIFENSAATQLTRTSADWVIRTNHGKITAKHVILSVNGHLESFGFARQRLMHVFLFATMTPDLPGDVLRGDPRWGITPSDPMGTTMRRIDTAQGGNRIITRTCAVLRPSLRSRPADLARAQRIMRRKFNDRFPDLSTVQTEYSWAGHLCLSRNGVGCVGEVEQGIFAACVQNGLGTTRGTLAGIAAAESVLGQSSDVTQHFANEAQPSRLPSPPFQQIGANAYLRYKEWRARTE